MRRVSLFIDDHLLAGLDALKAEHGTPHAESIRRAIAAYLAERGVQAKSSSKTRNRKRKRA
jgi:metal-responsive CopG/Arc/MetJ family transcriptional regulator